MQDQHNLSRSGIIGVDIGGTFTDIVSYMAPQDSSNQVMSEAVVAGCPVAVPTVAIHIRCRHWRHVPWLYAHVA